MIDFNSREYDHATKEPAWAGASVYLSCPGD